MMTLLFIRAFFLIISAVVGYQIGAINGDAFTGVIVGVCGGALLIVVEANLKQVSVRGLSSMVFGLLLGIFMANLVSDIISLLPLGDVLKPVLRVVLTLVFSYLGAVMALRGKDEFNLIIPYVRFKRQDLREGVIILDTSAIIDGRVGDIFKTGFLAGRLVVPRFVLHELQRLADSEDDLKRQRGRRGMEILKGMQKDTAADVRIHEDDFSGPESVDTKLVKLSKIMDARICTTDFNLSRIASFQGVEMLNINDLVNAVKPVVFTGEELEIRLVKEGKEAGQAIGYLEDGTMVVVSDGRKALGSTVKAYVTSALQTQAGRMIFAKMER
ncbi:MAG: twitching motility protein PilT [Candidatus Omnitrophica bacterium]|nr:twitching motility protein PilT [Candidatus Omnitrophota bacterium]MDE2222318.1 twitching motility protein PilT [Candidatus Omnitrophota bacterium]